MERVRGAVLVTLLLFICVLDNQGRGLVQSAGTSNQELTYTIGDELQRLELNLYTSGVTYNIRRSESSLFCDRINRDGGKCTAKLSLSLLSMNCDESNSKTNYFKIISTNASIEDQEICMDYVYLYTDVTDGMHKNLEQFKTTRDGFSITTVGNWSEDDTSASILVSIHYDLLNQECPQEDINYFDCTRNCENATVDSEDVFDIGLQQRQKRFLENPNNSICIPYAWICDKRPNCGLCGDADEAESVCYWKDQGGSSESSSSLSMEYALIALSFVVFFLVVPIVVLVLLGRITLRLFKNWRSESPQLSPSRGGRRSGNDSDVEASPPQNRNRRRRSSLASKVSEELPPSYMDVISGSGGLANTSTTSTSTTSTTTSHNS